MRDEVGREGIMAHYSQNISIGRPTTLQLDVIQPFNRTKIKIAIGCHFRCPATQPLASSQGGQWEQRLGMW